MQVSFKPMYMYDSIFEFLTAVNMTRRLQTSLEPTNIIFFEGGV